MVYVLRRNPLVRFLLELWWLPVLGPLLLWIFLARYVSGWLPYPGWVPVVYGAALAGIVGTACLNAAVAGLREDLRHRRARHRFLCPHCLRFSELRFACRACGAEVEPLIVHTHGAYVNDCAQCGAHLFSREEASGQGVQACCGYCSRVCEREVHHERQVRVVGVLRESDFTAFCAALGVPPERTRGGIDRAYYDDGVRLTFVLCLARLPGFVDLLPATHALWSVERIWLDGNDVEPLKLGEAVDRFLHRAGLTGAQRQAIRVYVGGEARDPALDRFLAARFGRVDRGIAPTEMVGADGTRLPAPRERAGAIGKGG